MRYWILFLFLLVLPSVAADVTTLNSYNLTDLPISGSMRFNFSLSPNASIYFTRIQSDGVSNLTYLPNITLDANHSIAEALFNYTIPFITDYTGNFTTLTNIVGVTNSINNNLALLTMRFNISHPPLLQQSGNESYMIVSNSGRTIQLNVYTVMGYNETRAIQVLAHNNSIIDIACGKYLTCPEHVMVMQNDSVQFDVQITVPKGEIAGNYSSYINLSLLNHSDSIDFEIVVRGEDVYNLMIYDVMDPSCYDDVESLANCYKSQARYNAEIAKVLLERLQAGNITGRCTDTIVNETIKYVEIGNIDPKLLDSNEECRNQYNTLSGDYSVLTSRLGTCYSDKEELSNAVSKKIENLSIEYITRRNDLESEYQTKIDTAINHARHVCDKVLLTISALLLIIAIVGAFMEARWTMPVFPTKILLAISMFIFLCWGIVRIFI